jgi:hypothetical protein
METFMLALVLALASADPSVATSVPPPRDDVAAPWRAVAFADTVTGAMGLEAPVGPLFVGVGGFAGGARSSSVLDGSSVADGPLTHEGGWAQAGLAAWLQGRLLELRVVDVSWVLRARGGWADTSFSDGGAGLGRSKSTSVFAGVAAGLVADARIVDGVALRVGVDLVEVGLRRSEQTNDSVSGAGDDVELGLLVPQAGIVVDLF